ncbi:uncharacterized protein LOC121738266 [Aricia agestis]|uniref:uncharacterized protein LOC121738266 n=1 Tax=Aricia agestis TaxID=91739 RepID=UPI001C20945A|nr:uncharacterized protein LOC121738266 [Aricia agestis]
MINISQCFPARPQPQLAIIVRFRAPALTTSRDSNGRYSVALPFKTDPASLGESRHIAERRFLSLERRLSVNPLVKREYDKIINEYIEKGYITIVNNNTLNSNQYYVIPHHAVVRGDKLTTKVRMVLNASMKTSSGISLNDILHTGRNLQSDLFRIILNFRLFPVAVSADIRQMFLQVTVKESFRQYQRILYRFNSNEPIQLYQFNRVTFGMTCSPYLAMRVIRQLMNDERSRFPIAVAALEKDAIYTDDVALSFRNTAEAITASKQLIDLFAAGGFDLVKFASNSSNFLGAMPSEARVTDLIDIGSDGNLKILGLQWSPASDNFCFRVTEDDRKCTKRNILSFVARIWDLMGFVAPVTLLAKLIIKSLWESHIEWDDPPPANIISLWNTFVNELPCLQQIIIPRFVGIQPHVPRTLLTV